jgi:trans-aconitate 2-methyltransferase
MTSSWNPAQYARFQNERSQPFLDLLARVPDLPARTIADLGCGTGELTTLLLARWPKATVWGVDNSEEMLARAMFRSNPPSLHFSRADLRDWEPPEPLDLLFSNAALQWVPEHAVLLARLVGLLNPEGVLAVQVPNNRSEAVYRIIDELLAAPRWASRVAGHAPLPRVETPEFYERTLFDLGCVVQAWETIYRHRFAAVGEITEWLKGTTLRPVLAALLDDEAVGFLDDLTVALGPAYPIDEQGVVFPFRRLFFVARSPQ